MSTAASEQPVVVGVDGSDAALGAARWAADFAARHALPLTLLHATPRLDWHFVHAEASADAADPASGDHVLAAAEAAVRSAHPELAIHPVEVTGGVATALADASQSARLLVLGSGSTDHRALGGHVVRTTHRAQCPVAVWRAPVATRTGKPLPVVVGVDDSDASSRALAEAFDIARLLHAPLQVVHMWELDAAVGMGDLGGAGNMDWPLLEVLETQQRQRMDELVEPLAKKYPNAHVTQVFQDTSPAKGLTDLSREAQLVVVGSHGRGRLADAILGSVSQNLIHHADCPVLVVR
ncbi:universal stress protein [Mycobacterium sp. M26]|uniref:universal stress protein n=1 Tax=Mycobacterium sp. M26 TaxID=1762962 RepID=UPI00073F6AD3|nr:universal stress protein [Mycobacterium sp. M26]